MFCHDKMLFVPANYKLFMSSINIPNNEENDDLPTLY